MRNLILGLLLLGLVSSLAAQDKTKVRFYVKGSSDYFMRLNGELLPHTNLQMIEPGTHQLEIWSPMHLQYTGTLDIPIKDSVSYYQKLERDPNYVKYLFEKDAYDRKMLFGKTVPLMASGLGAISAPILFVMRKRDHETLVKENFKATYIGNQDAAQTAQRRYALTNSLFFTSTVFAIGGAATYLILRQRLKSMPEPIYRQKNPFTLEDFELSYHPQLGVPQAGVTLSF